MTPQKATTLLLDMDGVLAEVSQSYRACIIATCHQYGAKSITLDTVADWKARGGCNNDWVLSFDLINTDPDGDHSVTLEQVTDTFERFYQGHGDVKGLCELESLIPRLETLQLLRQKCQHMAIVTGRPRKDCEAFLKLFNIDHLMEACVCMEDGPPKPDPFPVSHACELLGIPCDHNVILLGDTPDDVRSALAAGCRGVGVTTPEAAEELANEGLPHDVSKLAIAMKQCGAEVILEPGFEKLIDFF